MENGRQERPAPIKNYRDLIVWQRAMDLAEAVYTLTRQMPADERFGLTSQMRRASVSVPSNIAEGEGRTSDGDFVRFLQIAHGSLRELETQLELCHRLGFVDEEIEPTRKLTAEVGRLINGLIRAKRS
ncbi:MAG: four helix bundle protein [Tepidisphaeraceae bacterium]